MARRSRSRKAQVEVLEGRALLSGARPQLPQVAPGQALRIAAPRPEDPLQPLQVSSTFLPSKRVESFKQQVNAGDNLAVTINETNQLKDRLRIRVLGPNGRIVARTQLAPNPNLYIQASTTGTYTVQVIDPSPRAKMRDTVTLEVFGINRGTALPSAATDTGKRWAWLDGNALSIADPSGEGFQITSNWKETVQTDPATGMPYAIYTTSGPSTIKLSGSTNSPADQNLSITLDGPITVQTDPGLWGGHAGTIASTVFGNAPGLSLASSTASAASSGGVVSRAARSSSVVAAASAPTSLDANDLFAAFNEDYGLGVTLPGTGFGMASGQQLMAKASFSGIPLRPDGTYFYYQKNTGGSISFGGATATASGSQTVTVIIDPSDPFIFVAGGPIEFGASAKGLIPFVPASSSYRGPTFSGNLYGKINDIPIGNLPATASGAAVISLDPNQSGAEYNVDGNASSLFTKAGLAAAFSSIGIGVNGTVSAGTTFGGTDFTVDVGHATFAYVSPGTDPVLLLKPAFQGFTAYGVPTTLPLSQQNGVSTEWHWFFV